MRNDKGKRGNVNRLRGGSNTGILRKGPEKTGLNTFEKLDNRKNFHGKFDAVWNKMETLKVINAKSKIRSARN